MHHLIHRPKPCRQKTHCLQGIFLATIVVRLHAKRKDVQWVFVQEISRSTMPQDQQHGLGALCIQKIQGILCLYHPFLGRRSIAVASKHRISFCDKDIRCFLFVETTTIYRTLIFSPMLHTTKQVAPPRQERNSHRSTLGRHEYRSNSQQSLRISQCYCCACHGLDLAPLAPLAPLASTAIHNVSMCSDVCAT